MPDNPFVGGGGPFDPAGHRPNGANGTGTNGTNGVRPRGMHTQPVPFDDIEDPIDLVAVQADDELINALVAGMAVSSPGVVGYDADDRVAAILAAWKADVEAEPIPELVDVDTAVSTVIAARPPSRRTRHLAPVAAAAAFIVLAIGGLSVGSYSAQPEDALWPVARVLYSERAESVEAAARVQEHIANAKQALVAGQPVVAARELAHAEADLAVVRPEEGRTELAETQDFLVAKAAETPVGQPADPAAPLVTQPSRQVPSGAASPVPPSTPSQAVSPGTSPQVSGTPGPTSPGTPGPVGGGPGPEVADTTTQDPRRAAVAPDAATVSPTPTPRPEAGSGGDVEASPTSVPEPTATTEGLPDEPTTAPSGDGGTPSGSGDGTSGSTGATASGAEPQPTSS